MIFKWPEEGAERTRDSLCLWPLKFSRKTYWLEAVEIEEEYLVGRWRICRITPLREKGKN